LPSVAIRSGLRCAALGAALCSLAAAAAGETLPRRPDPTVRAVFPGCREIVATRGEARSDAAAFCNGAIDGVLYLGEMLPGDFCYAVPLDLPRHEVIAEVVREIEPILESVGNQNFLGLALDVLHWKWPCRPLEGK
jgi:hypothetical protein